MNNIQQKIIPNLWFDRQAEEAAQFYTSIFDDSGISTLTRATKAGYEFHHLPEGSVITTEFQIEGFTFVGINGGPIFRFNPSISFMVACETEEKVNRLWQELSREGRIMAELGEYPFNRRYGWVQDRFGLSWQLMFMRDTPKGQAVTPSLMFSGEAAGKAESAINFYLSVFYNSRIGDIVRYTAGQEPGKEGTLMYAFFSLEGQQFAAMDRTHDVSFNEAVSLMVECGTQEEIDYYWNKLTGDGGQENVCGWLKDRFGVSWQVTPAVLKTMLLDPDRHKVERVTDAYLRMKKFNIVELQKAFQGELVKP